MPPLAPQESYSQLLQREVSAKLMQVLSEQQLAAAAEQEEEAEEAEKEPSPIALPPGQSTPGAGMAAAPDGLVLPAGSPVVAAGAADLAGFDEPLLKWSLMAKKSSPQGRRVLPAAAASHGAAQLDSPPAARSPTHSRRMAPLHGPPSPTAAAPGSRPAAGSAGRPKPGSHMAPLSHTAPEAAGTSPETAGRMRRLSKPSMSEILAAAGARTRPAKAAGSRGGSLPGSRGGSAGWVQAHLRTAPPPVAPHLPPMQLAGAGLPPAAFPPLPPGVAPAGSGALLNWGRPNVVPPPVVAPGGWYMPAPAGFGAAPGQVAFSPAGVPTEQLAAMADGEAPAEAPAPPSSSGGGAAEAPIQEAPAAATGDLPAAGAGTFEVPAEAQGDSMSEQAQQAADGPSVDQEQAHPYAPFSYGGAPVAGPQQDVNVAASWPPYEGAKLPPLFEVGCVFLVKRLMCGAWTAGGCL